MEYVLTILFIIILVSFILFLFWILIQGSYLILTRYRHFKNKIRLTQSDIIRYESYLTSISYYQNLSITGKAKFVDRLVSLMINKEFDGREELKVMEEMKVLISASAIQLTFGLKEYHLWHYHTIRVYPKEFYSKIMGLRMKGGTSPGGMIALSWKDFKEGYEHPNDKYNLGLHELAHALKLDVTKGDDFDSRFANYLDDWEGIGRREFEKLRDGRTSFLRAYGGTNMHEFFAVCVEHFFEVPEDFKRELPDLYNHLCYLLNQNPTNIENDCALPNDFISSVNLF